MAVDDDNPFKPYAGTRRAKLQTPTSVAKKGQPTKAGQAVAIPGQGGIKGAGQASFSQAFSGLLDALTGTYSGPPMVIGPGARPYIKGFEPGKSVQAVVGKMPKKKA